MSEPRSIMPREAAGLLIRILERRGATFTLQPDGYFLYDLNGVKDIVDHDDAADLARIVLALREEIRVVLRAERTHH